jgi:hypothetical protein
MRLAFPCVRAGRGWPGADGGSKMQLVKYDAACRAVAEAKTIDEVKEITNRAEAARAYARQAKNRGMEIDAIEIRVRAERRLGEILIALRKDQIIGQGRCGRSVHLKDIGVDPGISAPSQRLAMLPEPKFHAEITAWRRDAETSTRLTVPLQNYRIPSVLGDKQKANARNGRNQLNQKDPFDKYRAPDGRRIADWRAGELNRLAYIFRRASAYAESLRNKLPVANPDPLATMEMIYDKNTLGDLLESQWDTKAVPLTDGLAKDIIERSRARRSKTCEHCSKEFIMKKGFSSQVGRFCSRQCSDAANQGRHRNK